MKKILIASFDLEVGGVERSLISMLEQFDYKHHSVDLMLYKHQGDFMSLLPQKVNLLRENRHYAAFRKSIGELLRNRQYAIGLSRMIAKMHAGFMGAMKRITEPGYYQMQLMWKYALPFLPKMEKKYDMAISYLWPHYFVAEKVNADTKVAWIHTDYSTVETDRAMDMSMWNKFDHIAAVSEACRDSFLRKYPELESKVWVVENITSPNFVRTLADEEITSPLLSDRRFKVMTVARLSHAKGIDQAVHTLKLLKDRGYDDIVWYVVGYGGDESAIRQLISKYSLEDRFILLGKQLNPYPFMRASDIYVQPSRYEGKAVTVTEAKILGKPILITNYPTAGSQVEDGYDGIICDLSVEGIARGIERLYHSEALRAHLVRNLKDMDFSNGDELEKLYAMIGNRNPEGRVAWN
ncbi:glycosyltransferase [Ferviditalea candida]|uniref:Glycosyltransferase n=1 Tax=Ferviditalea candida TaxID=3108399 RepID=A0ABU5ZI69_9BACL|nr:glycosyltransferase [Paenibacillaceae bacterium T2]